jgi:hypothetical protein
MLFTLSLKFEAYHKPTETWHIHEAKHGLRAVSRKHALNKGLRVLTGWPGYKDRDGHPDWTVDGSATIVEAR